MVALLPVIAALISVCQTFAAPAQTGPAGPALSAEVNGQLVEVLKGMRYEAFAGDELVFGTTDWLWDENNLATLQLDGPGAADAKISAQLTPLPRGCRLDWTIEYTGPQREWNPWRSCFHYDFTTAQKDARMRNATKWVESTKEKWDAVPGDTPYPDLEWQLREVVFENTRLVIASTAYDPDWFYGHDLGRVSFSRYSLPKETPSTSKISMVLLALPNVDESVNILAAEASQRPVALSIDTGHTANLYTPEEPLCFTAQVQSVTGRTETCRLQIQGYDYYGNCLMQVDKPLEITPQTPIQFDFNLDTPGRGILFFTGKLSWQGGADQQRWTCGILPERKAEGLDIESPFGLAAMIANPQAYADQYPPETVFPLAQRIGAKWLRTGLFTLSDSFTPEQVEQAKQKLELINSNGMSLHVQIGTDLPKLEDAASFEQKMRATLEQYRGLATYIEVGNELNFANKATDYVDRILKPVAKLTREIIPNAKVISMGLGGVNQDWLKEFSAAGGMDLIDILSIHPGLQPKAPEFWEGWRGWVYRSQVQDAIKSADGKPVWITEVYAPTNPQRSAVDLRTSADYLVRTYLCGIALGVSVSEWYQLQDGVWFAQHAFPGDVEYSFGIVYTDLTPKPAYIAFGVMTENLAGAKYLGRLDLGAPDLYGVRFERNDETIDILWSYREKHETDLPWWPPENYKDDSRKPMEPWVEHWQSPVAVDLPATNPVTITDIMGNARNLSAVNGNITLDLTGSPIYVRGLGDMPLLPEFWGDLVAF